MANKSQSPILATAGYDHQIRLWEVSSGFCWRTLPHPDSQVNVLAISPNRVYLAAGSFQQVRLFEIAGSNANVGPVSTMTGHKSNVIAVGFFPDGRLLFTGSEDGVVRIWDTRSASCLREYDAGEVLTAVVVHPNNRDLIIATQSGSVRTLSYNLGANAVIHACSPLPEASAINALAIRPGDTHQLAVANMKGQAAVVDLDTWAVRHTWKAHDAYILKACFSPNGLLLATCSSDTTIRLWSCERAYALEKTLSGHQRWVWDVAFAAQSAYLVSVSSDNVARLWDVAEGDTIRPFTGHRKAVTCVALNDTELLSEDSNQGLDETPSPH